MAANEEIWKELISSASEYLRQELDLGNRWVPSSRPAGPRPTPEAAIGPQGAGTHSAPSPGDAVSLEVLAEQAATCSACRLGAGRTRSVFARGAERAELMFVGEGPGYHEDQKGLPFVGRAGQLLDRMVTAMGFELSEVYICNVVKCRPPDNRTPTPDEAAACAPFLEGQIAAVRPRVIVALGRCAAEHLGLAEPEKGGWRGRWGRVRGIDAMATYHPAYLLRNPEQKRPVWNDLQGVVARMGRTLPPRPRASDADSRR